MGNSQNSLIDPAVFASRATLVAACLIGTLGVLIFAILPLLLGTAANSLGLSDIEIGFLGSMYVGGYTVVTALSFFWITRINWRHVFAFASLLLAGGLLIALVRQQYYAIATGLVIAGFGAGFMHALSFAIVAEMDDADRKFGIKMIPEQGISALLIFLVPVLVIATWGLPGLLLTLIALFLLATPLYPLIPRAGAKQVAAKGAETTPRKLLAVILSLFGLLLFFGGIAGIWAFLERFASDSDLDPILAGQLLAIGVLSSAVGPFVPAVLGDRFGRVLPLAVATAVLLVSLGLMSLPVTVTKYVVVLILLPTAWYAGMAYQMGIIAEADVTGEFSVLMAAALGVGATLGPGMLGLIKSSLGLTAGLSFAGLVVIGGTLVSIWSLRILEKHSLHQDKGDSRV